LPNYVYYSEHNDYQLGSKYATTVAAQIQQQQQQQNRSQEFVPCMSSINCKQANQQQNLNTLLQSTQQQQQLEPQRSSSSSSISSSASISSMSNYKKSSSLFGSVSNSLQAATSADYQQQGGIGQMNESKTNNESETSLGASGVESGGASGTESDTAEQLGGGSGDGGADAEPTSAASAANSQSHAPPVKPVIYAWMKKVHINNSGLFKVFRFVFFIYFFLLNKSGIKS
jgi:hypothetical protein